ncbi:MAG: pdxH [Gemmataceae bacterium]|nr:pdxH [Gemmataceae bacterium]
MNPPGLTMPPSLADLRQNYSLGGLSEAEAGDDPFTLFRLWFDQALGAGLPEPNAMILATCTTDGVPSARIVLLKALDDSGFTFFTNYDSRKGGEMAANPRVALVFPWHALERQVRVEGAVEKVTPAESDEYFANRPLGSRLGAWASAQSAVIPGREFLERRHAELMALYPDGNVPRPPNWGGYRVIPSTLEFWQGRPSRLHDRILFTRQADGGWTKERLAP